eukprot:TRINITY_DN12256_c0_g1_i1.p2 TRINITY_DN12256_c0_g1~~TRINITY_DN12256_c0_g1_i1.p2  ORF type:complete len:152 (+),score=18.61 TRINITY_DN12256_c0_g1_i1:108-563(+)
MRLCVRKGVPPKTLFGSAIDATKFAETMTFFAIAAREIGDEETLAHLADAIDSCRPSCELEARTVKVVSESFGLSQYAKCRFTRDLAPLQSRATARLGPPEVSLEAESVSNGWWETFTGRVSTSMTKWRPDWMAETAVDATSAQRGARHSC